MATSHQQVIADAGSDTRPPMLEKGSYVSWASHFRRNVDGRKDNGRRARILELKRRYFEDYCSDNQYAISIKEDTAYLCLHSPKDHEGNMINTPYPKKTNTPYWRYIKGVTTRGGKTTTQDAQNDDTSVHRGTAKRLRKEKEEAQQKKFLENLKQLHINMLFIEVLAQMPKYAKFLKGLLTNKARLEEACTITMNERCSTVLLNKLPSKEKTHRVLLFLVTLANYISTKL
ncbi:hypothetical protein Tco_0587086 [Tanacetum coccineum]